jgi:putative ABC transport system substrate-binding protein
MPVSGVLRSTSSDDATSFMSPFSQGFREAVNVEGRNIAIHYRWADGQFDRLPAWAADLVGRNRTRD